jgi:hypothetical protein
VTRLFAAAAAVALSLAFWSFLLLQYSPKWSAVVGSLGLGVAVVLAVVSALVPVTEKGKGR